LRECHATRLAPWVSDVRDQPLAQEGRYYQLNLFSGDHP